MSDDVSVTAREDLRLFIIFPGPVHDLTEKFGDRLLQLSEFFSGTVIMTGPEPVRTRFGRFDVVVMPDPVGLRIRSHFAFVREALALARRTGGIDAIVTYDPLKSGLTGLWLSRKQGARLIVELNGDYTAPANYADVRNPLLRLFKRKLYIGVERFVLRRASAISLLYPEQIDPFRNALRDPLIRVIPTYVNLTAMRYVDESKQVLFVGSPYFIKGVDLLINAFTRVSDEFPDWTLKLLGWFPNLPEVQAAVGDHPRIMIHPPVYHRDMWEHMGRCGIFVLPSRTEAFGSVLLEAMACRKPVIGARVGGIPTIIEHGESGLLFAAGDYRDLASALRRLMGDAVLRERLAANGAQRLAERFSSAAYFRQIDAFYREVIRLSRADRPSKTLVLPSD